MVREMRYFNRPRPHCFFRQETKVASPTLHLTRIFHAIGGAAPARKAPLGAPCLKFQALHGSKAPKERHLIVVRQTRWGVEGAEPLLHAAPLELTALSGGRYYNHGAPAGA